MIHRLTRVCWSRPGTPATPGCGSSPRRRLNAARDSIGSTTGGSHGPGNHGVDMLAIIGDRRTHYDLTGPTGGDVVCLVHGLLMDAGVWADQVGVLHRAGLQVLRIDLRGHGGSETGEGRFNPDDLARDLILLLNRLEIETVHYVGISLGGVVGLAIALSRPDRISSLTVCSTPTATFPDPLESWRGRAVEALNDESTRTAAQESLRRWFPEDFQTRRPEAYKRIYETAAATRPEGYAGCLEALQGYDYDARLGEITTPTLVVCGAADVRTDAAHHRRIADRILNAEYHVLPATGHLPNVERPDDFNHILVNWLARGSQGATH